MSDSPLSDSKKQPLRKAGAEVLFYFLGNLHFEERQNELHAVEVEVRDIAGGHAIIRAEGRGGHIDAARRAVLSVDYGNSHGVAECYHRLAVILNGETEAVGSADVPGSDADNLCVRVLLLNSYYQSSKSASECLYVS